MEWLARGRDFGYFAGAMLTHVHLKNFCGFKDTAIGPLNRVNLIVGQNNTGKTGLLEALTLLLTDPPQNTGNLPNLFRSMGGDSIENVWKWICFNKQTQNSVELAVRFEDSTEFGLALGANRPRGLSHDLGTLGNIHVFRLAARLRSRRRREETPFTDRVLEEI